MAVYPRYQRECMDSCVGGSPSFSVGADRDPEDSERRRLERFRAEPQLRSCLSSAWIDSTPRVPRRANVAAQTGDAASGKGSAVTMTPPTSNAGRGSHAARGNALAAHRVGSVASTWSHLSWAHGGGSCESRASWHGSRTRPASWVRWLTSPCSRRSAARRRPRRGRCGPRPAAEGQLVRHTPWRLP